MKVYLRKESSADGVPFCECRFDEIESVMAALSKGGKGIYCDGETWTDLDYQFVLSDGDAYAEIILNGA